MILGLSQNLAKSQAVAGIADRTASQQTV